MYISAVLCKLFVFLFQAEDGIRDGRVTGVQTCALPISRAVSGVGGDERLRRAVAPAHAARQCAAHRIDHRRHQLPAGSAAADESLRRVAQAAARQPQAVKRQGWLTNDVYALQNLM